MKNQKSSNVYTLTLEVRGKNRFVQDCTENAAGQMPVYFDRCVKGDFVNFEKIECANVEQIAKLVNKFYNYGRKYVDGINGDITVTAEQLNNGQYVVEIGKVYISPANRKRLYKGVPANKAKDDYSIVEARIIINKK